ncbi:hypothetical protein ACQKWADRAFT_301625 [Trichoderma austrokoningii]
MESLFELQFETFDEARAALDTASLPIGVSLVKRCRRGPNKMEFRCSKGKRFKSQGNSELPASQRRETSSQMTGCPFKLVINRLDASSPWKIQCVRGDRANEDNHKLLPPAALSRFRNTIIETRKAQIISLYNSRIGPAQILTHLQSNGDPDVNGLTLQDICNTIRRHHKEMLNRRTEMHWMYNKL